MASTGCRKKAGVPVEFRVAAIFLADNAGFADTCNDHPGRALHDQFDGFFEMFADPRCQCGDGLGLDTENFPGQFNAHGRLIPGQGQFGEKPVGGYRVIAVITGQAVRSGIAADRLEQAFYAEVIEAVEPERLADFLDRFC